MRLKAAEAPSGAGPSGLRGNSRWRLLKATVRLFAEKGCEGTGIREVAGSAGVNTALIYFYFGGKEGLHLAALQLAGRQARRLVAALPELPGPGDPLAGYKAVAALRALAGRLLQVGLEPAESPTVRGLQRAILVLAVREMARPRPERALFEALAPVLDYLDGCVRILRPDLDPEERLRMAVILQGQLLIPLTFPGLFGGPGLSGGPGLFGGPGLSGGSILSGPPGLSGPAGSGPFHGADPDTFAAQIMTFSLDGLKPRINWALERTAKQ